MQVLLQQSELLTHLASFGRHVRDDPSGPEAAYVFGTATANKSAPIADAKINALKTGFISLASKSPCNQTATDRARGEGE